MTDLHHTLLTLDSHIDIPWPDRQDAWTEDTARQVNVPKAIRGGMRAVCLAAYIPQSSRDESGHVEAWERVQAMLDVICEMGGHHNGQGARVCRSASDVRAAYKKGDLAVIPAIENGHALGGRPERIVDLAQRYGVRYMTLTHNGHNVLADAAIPRKDLADEETLHGGLSALGRDTIAAMNRSGVLVDVSHASKSTMMQASGISTTPVFASHSCARALCDHPRNLDDEQLDRLKDTGGLIQVTAMGSFLKKGGGGTVEDLVRHVSYIAERIGIEHVGISSDFDGGGGIPGWKDATETVNVTRALVAAGFTDSEIAAIWGGNMLRLLEQAEKAAEAT
ncbi:dipeptidase [Gluconobacter kanchanaburiensis]|uniref:Peptidase n=1 Tax=Gluconobacter kanchanaburiensis NBRC 103587 TaxID=1307948 RepID=A0A511B8D4_9PROT|nr:dipeptidase [Gluconobacter kanchanaburiensis]MBF0862536.1 membrane dipeptidase [Gluconobacter kanchanaburiensis]GBR71713.1 dipeptidase [Gluconobacter kanchanaburiensis NBRC 103587]GEK96658.1 peptidase [Gluconobacter kanchanaburiensis NBRC 103587]